MLISEYAFECSISKQLFYVLRAYVVYFETVIKSALLGLCNETEVKLSVAAELPEIIASSAPITRLSSCN